MTMTRVITISLAILLLSLQGQLWFGKRSVSTVSDLRVTLDALERDNAQATVRNEQMQVQVDDLVSGVDALEEKARFEQGMIKPNELFVQYVN